MTLARPMTWSLINVNFIIGNSLCQALLDAVTKWKAIVGYLNAVTPWQWSSSQGDNIPELRPKQISMKKHCLAVAVISGDRILSLRPNEISVKNHTQCTK
jgi:hypothetical protein